jgi:hypothetical protein
MYVEYIIYNFSMTIRLHVVLHETLTNKLFLKKMKYPFIKYPFWYGSDFFLNIYIIMHLLLNKWFKKKSNFIQNL